jgi:hypothetical protein
MTDDALLFIDANKYLDLYQTKTGKLILAALTQQANHIFVTQKVVDEVKRNKVKVTAEFLTKNWELVKAQTYNVPDHLFGAGEDQSKSILRQMEEIRQKIKQVNTELNALAGDIMRKVSQSTDEVSTALAPIFANAVYDSGEQLRRATARKERGDPPGKQANPIGDQLTWEQLLHLFRKKTKLWIITRDNDYGTFYNGKGFLNHFLYEELVKVSPGAEVFLFDNVPEGIKHFADTTGVPADKLPSPEEIGEIKNEEQTLPPGRQYFISNYPAAMAAVQAALGFSYFHPQGGGFSTGGLVPEQSYPFGSGTTHTQPTQGSIRPVGHDPPG